MRAAEWPVRYGARNSVISRVDLMCRWQSLRGLAYIQAVSASCAPQGLLQDIDVRPSGSGIGAESFSGLLGRLERHAKQVPDELLEIILRACTPLLVGDPYSGFAVSAGLASSSRPSLEDGIERAAAISGFWSSVPQLRPALAMAWSVSSFIAEWLSWPGGGEYVDSEKSLGIGIHPAPERPSPEDLPSWLMGFIPGPGVA
ncbi:hypothetical protein OHA61_23130 [Streptomyces sp. NBC_00885]|uniref:hypothetical protein n=1 Tax=Streptomyces sp. NBC_00885 TaxID=2975857 RepID=UPI003866BA74|nr:hypothetical protein OHA61_23130 [Streptomyces sp. NBC_00885]